MILGCGFGFWVWWLMVVWVLGGVADFYLFIYYLLFFNFPMVAVWVCWIER